MNIEELLTKYTDLAHKRDEAYEKFSSFEAQINYLVHDNKVPVELKDIEGNTTGFTITAPDDLWKARSGMLIDTLEWAWDDCNTFEVPMWEEPYAYFLRVTVDPFNEQVTVERSFS